MEGPIPTKTSTSPDASEKRGDSRRGRSRSRSGSPRHSARRDDNRRSNSRSRYDRDRDGYDRRSSSRYDRYDRYDRDSRHPSRGYRDDRDRRSSSRRSRTPSPSKEKEKGTGSSVMDLLKKIPGLGGPAAGAGAPAPGGFGLGSFGSFLTPGADMQAALARIQAQNTQIANPNPIDKAVRELYVGGLPQGAVVNANQIREFFNTIMTQSGLVTSPGQPVIQARLNETGTFAFVQFRTQEETDMALTLNGIPYLGSNLKIGRPRGWQQAMAHPSTSTAAALPVGPIGGALPLGSLGAIPSNLASIMGNTTAAAAVDKPTDVLLVSNLPTFLDEAGVREVFSPFGTLTHCVVLPAGGAKTARSLLKFADSSILDAVIAGMNNVPIGDLPMIVARAATSLVSQHLPQVLPASAASPPAPAASPVVEKTDTLELHNIVIGSDLSSPQEVTEIEEDVAEECGKYGRIVQVYIPVPKPGSTRGCFGSSSRWWRLGD